MAWNPYVSRQMNRPVKLDLQNPDEDRAQSYNLAKGINQVADAVIQYKTDEEKEEYKSAKIEAALSLGDIDNEVSLNVAQSVLNGDTDVKKTSIELYNKLRGQALKGKGDIYIKAFDDLSAESALRLSKKINEAQSKALAVKQDSELSEILINDVENIGRDPSILNEKILHYSQRIEEASIPLTDKKKRRLEGVVSMLGEAIKREPLKISKALMDGEYKNYLSPEESQKLAKQADDEAFYKVLRQNPEMLENNMDMFKSYDEKTRYQREKQIASVLKSAQEKQNKGTGKEQAVAQSAMQEIQSQYYTDVYKEMENSKKTNNVFDVLDYREAVGKAYSTGALSEKQFVGLMKKTVKPLIDASSADKYNEPFGYESVFEYGIKRLNATYNEQMQNPQIKTAIFDAYYQKIRDAGLNPNDKRADANKRKIWAVLNDVARDLADSTSNMIIPEKAGAMVLGGRYYPLNIKEPGIEPAKVPAYAAENGLEKDAHGNILERNKDVKRIMQVKPPVVRKRRTFDDVLLEVRETPEEVIQELML